MVVLDFPGSLIPTEAGLGIDTVEDLRNESWPSIRLCAQENLYRPLMKIGGSLGIANMARLQLGDYTNPILRVASLAIDTTCQSTRSKSGINIGNSNEKDTLQEEAARSSKGKGKAVLKPTQDEGKGPRTRNHSRRKAALDKDTLMKSVNEDSMSEV
ncbi:hypothetical protein Tco_0499858 [Tanacetum coccineum]